MDLLKLFMLVALCSCPVLSVTTPQGGGLGAESEGDEDLDDFPLDPGGASDRSDDPDTPASNGDQELDDLADIDLTEVQQTESNRQELLRKVMVAAMARPGARQRLAQVMPILRTMSATQRLALAGLVTSQLMSPPGAPPPAVPHNTTRTNLTDNLMIPISMDIAAMFRGLGRDASAASRDLFRGNLYKRNPMYKRRPPQMFNRRNTEVPIEDMKPPPPPRVKLPKRRPGPGKLHIDRFPPPSTSDLPGAECEFFTNNLCLQVADYPMESILKSIQSTPNKNAFEALRSDSKQDFKDIYPTEGQSMERRQGETVDSAGVGHMCSSKVEVARPKRARATSGQWKYIVNTGDYTQTLRLEMCLRPKEACSFLANGYKSECTQVYNYHRLLTWDQKSGLTMDIFKVPTCCSCHVQSPTHMFPLTQTQAGSESVESVRSPSQPVEPIRHATPPPRLLYAEPEAPENNFVVAEEPPAIHRLPPTKQVLNRRPGVHNNPKRESFLSRPVAPPRRQQEEIQQRYPGYPQYENLLRRTISQRNGSEFNEVRPKYHPVQPTLNQRHPELPVDSLLTDNSFSFVTSVPDYQSPPRTYQSPRTPSTTPRRVLYQATPPSTPKRVAVTYASTSPSPLTSRRTTPSQASQATTTPSSKRVNYSYHPIIDFFKMGASAAEAAERMGTANAEWTPITEPRVMPK